MKDSKETFWLTRARDTYEYHAYKKKLDKKWKVQDTAKALRRSIGAVSEDLTVIKWMKNNLESNDMNKFDYIKDALEFIRENKEV
jgi:hypothetical protein